MKWYENHKSSAGRRSSLLSHIPRGDTNGSVLLGTMGYKNNQREEPVWESNQQKPRSCPSVKHRAGPISTQMK